MLVCTYASERLEIRFNHLTSDLFSQRNTLIDVFNCVQELRDGTLRHFILKKFFWKVRILCVVHCTLCFNSIEEVCNFDTKGLILSTLCSQFYLHYVDWCQCIIVHYVDLCQFEFVTG